MKHEDAEGSPATVNVDFKPSLVCQVLAAVSGTTSHVSLAMLVYNVCLNNMESLY